jgi:hypothetical protein
MGGIIMMNKLGLSLRCLDASTMQGGLPAMLANWVGDDSSQVTDGAAFDPSSIWTDRISGIELVGQTGGNSPIMKDTYFNGHKAASLLPSVSGWQTASPCGISDTAQDYTIILATRLPVLDNTKAIFSHQDAVGTDFIMYYKQQLAPTYSYTLYNEPTWGGTYTSPTLLAAADPVSTDTIVTIELIGSDVKIYRDGVLVCTHTGEWSARAINGDFALGALYGVTNRTSNEATAEVRIYPALSQPERLLAEAELMEKYLVPDGAWVDESGNILVDESGNNLILS